MKYSHYLLAALSSIIFLSPGIIMGMKKTYTKKEINAILRKTAEINKDIKNRDAFISNNLLSELKALATGFMYVGVLPLSIYALFAPDLYYSKN